MTRDEVLTGIAVLKAAFPHSTVPTETIELYVSRLIDYRAEPFTAAVKDIIDQDQHFPPVARLVEAYRKRRDLADAEEERIARSSRLALPPPVQTEGVLRSVVDEYRHGRFDYIAEDALAFELSKLERTPGGRCDECREPASVLVRYGEFLLCEGDARRRLAYRLRTETAA